VKFSRIVEETRRGFQYRYPAHCILFFVLNYIHQPKATWFKYYAWVKDLDRLHKRPRRGYIPCPICALLGT